MHGDGVEAVVDGDVVRQRIVDSLLGLDRDDRSPSGYRRFTAPSPVPCALTFFRLERANALMAWVFSGFDNIAAFRF
jgi:hypothetical protein